MKKLLLLLFVVVPMLFAYPQTTDAMKMSAPVYLGGAIYSDAGGTFIKGAVINTGKVVYTDVFDGERYTTYDKGYAVFGKDDLTIYAHYDIERYGSCIGANNISNTIETGGDITAIRTDSGIVFYYVVDSYHEGGGFVILGKLPDGRFVQYVDSRELEEKYNWWTNIPLWPDYLDAQTENNVIIIPYSVWMENDTTLEGELRFTWDEKAQWFGVEKR